MNGLLIKKIQYMLLKLAYKSLNLETELTCMVENMYHRTKKVIDTETGIVYDCAKEVAHKFGILYNTLANCLNGHRKIQQNLNTFKS